MADESQGSTDSQNEAAAIEMSLMGDEADAFARAMVESKEETTARRQARRDGGSSTKPIDTDADSVNLISSEEDEGQGAFSSPRRDGSGSAPSSSAAAGTYATPSQAADARLLQQVRERYEAKRRQPEAEASAHTSHALPTPNEDQQEVLNVLEGGESCHAVGDAGTGKTTLELTWADRIAVRDGQDAPRDTAGH